MFKAYIIYDLYAQAILADWVKCSDTPKDSLQASTVD